MSLFGGKIKYSGEGSRVIFLNIFVVSVLSLFVPFFFSLEFGRREVSKTPLIILIIIIYLDWLNLYILSICCMA